MTNRPYDQRNERQPDDDIKRGVRNLTIITVAVFGIWGLGKIMMLLAEAII